MNKINFYSLFLNKCIPSYICVRTFGQFRKKECYYFILISFLFRKLTSVLHLHNLGQFVLRIFDTLLGRMGNTNIAI